MEHRPSWEADSRSAIQEIPTPPLMEPEDSLPCSQGPKTGLYPVPEESSPHIPTLSP
jgi:hypothetical protein